ncbi:MAG: formate dehydrogenase accessory sulfurtransferase FdhD [Polyangiaceae bacterium]
MKLPSDRTTRAGIVRANVVRSRDGKVEGVEDALAVEEPLQVRVFDEPWTTTLRTPGSDNELIAGLLLAEGVIQSELDLLRIAPCERLDPERTGNVVEVQLAPSAARHELEASRRRTLVSAACGVCGRASIDELLERLGPLVDAPSFDAAWLAGLPAVLAAAQRNFAHTGGLHAAAIVEPERGTLVVREDVGRHNAVDKAIGRLLLDRALPAKSAALVVSGRAGFEIVQKALAARISALVSVSAPSSLAVGTAARSGLLLLGFARDSSFNVYAGVERLRGLDVRGI